MGKRLTLNDCMKYVSQISFADGGIYNRIRFLIDYIEYHPEATKEQIVTFLKDTMSHYDKDKEVK